MDRGDTGCLLRHFVSPLCFLGRGEVDAGDLERGIGDLVSADLIADGDFETGQGADLASGEFVGRQIAGRVSYRIM